MSTGIPPVVGGMGKTLANLGDDELLRLMMSGDAAAFEMLYERREKGIYRFALRMSGSPAIAEDVTHDVFIALMRDGWQYDGSRGTVATYLYGMARNRILRRLERDKTFVPINEEDEQEGGMNGESFIQEETPFTEYSRNEIVDTVRQAILTLPAHYREVIVLCHLQEMNYEEAAGVIGCAVGTVRSRLHRARAILSGRLQAIRSVEAPAEAIAPKRCIL